jgi:hypothetical protein
MRLERRIRALEARMIGKPVVLRCADGSTREIHGRSGFLLTLFLGAIGGANLSAAQAAQLDLIRSCVDAQEPGGGHMVELLQALLNGPVEETGSR